MKIKNLIASTANRTYRSNRKCITPISKRYINSIVNHTGTVTKLGRFTQSNGLDRNQQQLGWQNEALVRNNEVSRFLDTQRRSAEVKINTTHNGHETTELPVNNLSPDLENIKANVNQLNLDGNLTPDSAKILFDNFLNNVLIHFKSIWVDSISKLTVIDELAVNLEATVSLRLIMPLSYRIDMITRNYIIDNLSINDNLFVITIDRFEIFITNMTWQPFFNEFLPKIHNLIININSYELSHYELHNTSYFLQNQLGISEDINNWLNIKNNLVMDNFYSDYNNLMDMVLFLGEGNMLTL